jgi:hypothetical protein
VWIAAISRLEYPRLIVIDTTTDKVYEISHADGLPGVKPERNVNLQLQQELVVAPLGPGRVCAAGGFGRAWIAMIEFSPEAGPKVDVFHEAKTTPEPSNRDQWRDPQVAFRPSHLFVLEGTAAPDGNIAGKIERKLCLGRNWSPQDIMKHPLVINPETLQVEVMQSEFLATKRPLDYWQHEGTVYFLNSSPEDYNRTHLYRLGLPGPKVERVCELPYDGNLLITGKQFHLAGVQWFQGDWSTKTIQPAGPIPWVFASMLTRNKPPPIDDPSAHKLFVLSPSNHYGLLAHYGRNSNFHIAQITLEATEAGGEAKVEPK